MEEWKYIKVSELCKKVCSGGTPKSTVSAYYGGEIPWLNTKEINFNRIYKTEKNITQEGLDNSSAKWIEENSVVVAMYGATAGKCAISKIPLTTNQACCNLMINNVVADYRYVYYALCNDYVKLSSLANGGAQQNLNAQQIKDFGIPYRELKEQKAIANILSSFDDKIALNQRINDNLEQQAEALYKSWFVDFEPFKGGKFVDSELGKIPEGWEVGNLKELVTVKYGKDHKKLNDGKIPVYGSGGIMRYVDDFLYFGESVLIPRKGTLNNVFYVNEHFWSVDTMFYTEMQHKNIAKYIYFFVLSQNLASMNAGSAVPSMTTDILNSLKCIIAPLDIMNKFEIIQAPIFEIMQGKREEIQRLSQIRDSLLPKLMSGELKISDLNS